MRRFTQLFRELDESNRTGDKEAVLERYFGEVAPEDAVWALWFFWGKRLKLGIPPRRLRQWSAELTGYPDWLVDACNERVGDQAETAALLLPLSDSPGSPLHLHAIIGERLIPLQHWDDRFQFQLLREFWLTLNRDQAVVLNKMISGGFTIGVTRIQLVCALSNLFGQSQESVARRLAGDWEPTAAFFQSLATEDQNDAPDLLGEMPPSLALMLEELADHRRVEAGGDPRHVARLVLIYAQAIRGRPAGPFTDLTLAARDGDKLVRVARAECELPDAVVQELDAWIKGNTVSRRGPVRTVPGERVFEVGFEGLRKSGRHKAGFLMRCPRILSWLKDTPLTEADTLDHLRERLDG